MPDFLSPLLISLSIGFGAGAALVVNFAFLFRLRLRIVRSDLRQLFLLVHVLIEMWSIGLTTVIVFATMDRLRYFGTGFEPVIAGLLCVLLIWYGMKKLIPRELTGA